MKRPIKAILSAIILAVLAMTLVASASAAGNGSLDEGLLLRYDFSVYNKNTEYFKNLASDAYGDIEYTIGDPSAIKRGPGALGAIDSALYFDGTNGLNCLSLSLSGLKRCSVSVWLKADAFPGETNATPNFYIMAPTLWDVGSMQMKFVWGAAPGTCELPIKGNGKIAAGTSVTNDKVNYYTNYRSPVLTPGEWTLVSAVYDSDAKNILFYKNGELLETATITDTAVELIFNDLWLGYYPGSGAQYKGWLEDFRMYDRLLTADEVRALYLGDGRNITADLSSFYAEGAEVTTAVTTAPSLVTTAPPPVTAAPDTGNNTTTADTSSTIAAPIDVPAETDGGKGGCGSLLPTSTLVFAALAGSALSLAKKKKK